MTVRRIFACLVVVALPMAILAGCSPQGSASSGAASPSASSSSAAVEKSSGNELQDFNESEWYLELQKQLKDYAASADSKMKELDKEWFTKMSNKFHDLAEKAPTYAGSNYDMKRLYEVYSDLANEAYLEADYSTRYIVLKKAGSPDADEWMKKSSDKVKEMNKLMDEVPTILASIVESNTKK